MPSSMISSPGPLGSGGRRRRRRRPWPRRPPTRDWSELPLDAISYVFGKLGVPELLAGGAMGVCRSWRLAARKDPSLWRHVDMRCFYGPAFRKNARPGDVARAAVRFSAGQCDAFWGMYDVDDDLLLFLSEQAPLLKSLRLSQCNISRQGFEKAIEKFPLLEELELELCQSVSGNSVYELISKACPQLKHFGHTKARYWRYSRDNDADYVEALAIARMHELRSLQLYRIHLSNEGLAAILDGCLHLEYLDLRNCTDDISKDDTLRARCARIKTKKLLIDGSNPKCEEFEPGSPISSCSTCWVKDDESDRHSDVSDIKDFDDSSDSSYDVSGVDEIDIDEHDMMIEKNMRRYLLSRIS
ncbi:unnamed protein product [Urochloa decumbens]|uniref:F-box domain-containing protein n=1 Tax=Urochloa decumbens TaxID=240449 RepID=A0ABC9EZ39_9POAL